MTLLCAALLSLGLQDSTEALIDRLVQVAEGDIGYDASVGGEIFLPLQGSGRVGVELLNQPAPVSSGTMREIVRRGAAAAPALLAHLGDARVTRLAGVRTFGSLWFRDEYDVNRRTTPEPEADVDCDDAFEKDHPARHDLTVGDLCFVALGQVLNRRWNAIRYQPTMIVVVSSTSYSAELRRAVLKEWGGLTPQRHQEALLADLRKPDHADRRVGAAMRLAFYYPETYEKAVLEELARPIPDGQACVDLAARLYGAAPDRWAGMLDAFGARHGDVGRDGVFLALHNDLRDKEAAFQILRRLFPDRTPADRRVAADRPAWVGFMDPGERAGFIASLKHDRSGKIDLAVKEILAGTKYEPLVAACTERLLGRGFDKEIEESCPPAMREKLGWTAVHVAVDREEEIPAGADVNKAARNGETPLHLAARLGRGRAAAALLARGADPNVRDGRGWTPLQAAVHEERFEAADAIVRDARATLPDLLCAAYAGSVKRAGELVAAEAGAKTHSGGTALHLAARQGDAAVVKLLLDKGAEVGTKLPQGRTALHLAVNAGHAAVVDLLLRAGAEAREPIEGDGYEPLHLAAFRGNLEIARLLLDAKAAPDARESATGSAPLHWAAEEGHLAVAKLLLERKADVKARDKEGHSPFRVAARAGRKDMVELLLAAGADLREQDEYGQNALHDAARKGHRDVAVLLLDSGLDAKKAANGGVTPLMGAAEGGHRDVVELLLDRKADVDAANHQDATALVLTCEEGRRDVAALLLEKGANPNAGKNGTALAAAVRIGDRDLVELLLKHGAKADARDEYRGETPLQAAARQGRDDLARLMLARGATLDIHSAAALGEKARVEELLKADPALLKAASRRGALPIHHAAARGRKDVVELLLDRGAATESRDDDYRTPLHLAAREARLEVMELLIARKADVNVHDGNARPPLAYARGRERAADLLRAHGAKDE